MRVHVLIYDSGQENEGIHSLELSGSVVVLMFENLDDANRYSGLLEAQDFPVPTVEEHSREDIEAFCNEAGYEGRFVPNGFVPSTEEERLLLAPPVKNKDVSNWHHNYDKDNESSPSPLDDIRNRLEDLL